MANKSVRTKLTQLVPASRRIMNRYERLSERVSLYDNIATVHKVRRMPLFQLSLPNARVVAARYVLLAILIYDVCFAMLFRCDTIYIYVINDMRACTFKHIMLHFHSGNDKLKEHFAAPRKKILPSSTASDCYGYCETYVFTYFHMQHVVTCLDSLRVRGYTFSRMGCRKQWGGTGLFYDRDESTWSDSADSLRRFFVFKFFFFIASSRSLYFATVLAIWFVQCLLRHENINITSQYICFINTDFMIIFYNTWYWQNEFYDYA